MKDNFISIGEVLTYLKEGQISNLEKRAQCIQDFINKENKSVGFAFDRYLEKGPATFMNVVAEHSGAKQECILWCVNHYLSLNRNANIIEKACKAMRQYGTGCGTSASSCGMTSLHKEVEKKLANLVRKEKAILFPTGFTTNLGSISYLAGNKDMIIFDRECHSSIINGIKLSKTKKWISFKHNNVADLAMKLRKFKDSFENIFVIVESAYSMSGDLSPLQEIISLKKMHKFYLYVDEAHTFGIYGEKGQGYCYEQGLSDKVDFIISTLSKATASIGGFFSADEKYCSLLKWSDPYVFQACLTPADAAVILASLEEIENNPLLIKDLHAKNSYMRNLLVSRGFNLRNSRSPIIPIFIEDHNKLRMVVNELYLHGIYSTPVVFPAVKVNEGRIRFILNYNHTKAQIDYTVEVLEKVCEKYQIIRSEINQINDFVQIGGSF